MEEEEEDEEDFLDVGVSVARDGLFFVFGAILFAFDLLLIWYWCFALVFCFGILLLTKTPSRVCVRSKKEMSKVDNFGSREDFCF